MTGGFYYPKHQHRTTKRVCLKCNKKFNSTGKGNRLCATCNARNQAVATGCRRYTNSGDGTFSSTEAE